MLAPLLLSSPSLFTCPKPVVLAPLPSMDDWEWAQGFLERSGCGQTAGHVAALLLNLRPPAMYAQARGKLFVSGKQACGSGGQACICPARYVK